MNSWKLNIFIVPLLLLLAGCKQEKKMFIENPKPIDPNVLVNKLRQEKLIEKFKNYTIVPRDELTDVYIFAHTKYPEVEYYLGYDNRGPDYFRMDDESEVDILKILKKVNPTNYKTENDNYLNDAYILITAMKNLNIRNVNSLESVCYITFNSYKELIYIEDNSKIDERLSKRLNDFKRIDKYFVYQ